MMGTAVPRPEPRIPPADGVDWKRAFIDLWGFTVTHLDRGWATDPPAPRDEVPPGAWTYLTDQAEPVRAALRTDPAYARAIRSAIREVDA